MKKKLIISFFILFLFFGWNVTKANEVEDATLFYNEAIDLFRQDNVDKSIELFNKAIEIYPDFYEAHYNLAQILMSINKNDQALKSLEIINKLKPEDSETLYNIGRIYFKKGYLSKANEYLKKINEQAPEFESSKILLTKIAKRQDELNLEAKLKERSTVSDEKGRLKGVNLVEVAAPSGSAIDSLGNIYVASFSENAIYKISIYGQKTLLSKSSLIQGPIGLAIDKNNDIYVANYISNNIIKISPDGLAHIFAEIQKPYCLTYDYEHNRLYVTEQSTNNIVKFDL